MMQAFPHSGEGFFCLPFSSRRGRLGALRVIPRERGEKHERETETQRFFRENRVRPVRCRGLCRPGQYLAVPLSGRQIWRRYFSAGLHHPGPNLWLHHDRSGDRHRPHDGQEPRRCFHLLRLRQGAEIRRLDQRRHPHPDRALLLRHWWLGHQVSPGLPAGSGAPAGRRRLFWQLYFQRSVCGAVLYRLHLHDPGHHLRRCGKRHRAGIQGHDAHSRGALRDHCRLFHHPARSPGGRQILPGAQSPEFLLDDGGHRHGADVLLPVHRHGHPHYLRLLYEKEREH